MSIEQIKRPLNLKIKCHIENNRGNSFTNIKTPNRHQHLISHINTANIHQRHRNNQTDVFFFLFKQRIGNTFRCLHMAWNDLISWLHEKYTQCGSSLFLFVYAFIAVLVDKF